MIFQSILKIFPVQKPEPIEHIDWLLFEWKLSIDIPKKKKNSFNFQNSKLELSTRIISRISARRINFSIRN